MARPNGKAAESPEVPPTIAPTIQLTVAAPPESGIRIDYPGKLSVRSILGKLRPRVQRRLNQFCCGTEEEQANNLVIEGDNLQVMASLYRYRGQVDFIIADPPYNTGNDFRYNDRWEIDPNDPNPGELVADDDGGKHTKWMKFMAPRLEMMKAMLKPGGVCAICIDHRELFRLGMMMDEIFYESNRIAIINWQKSAAPRPDNRHVSTATEYVLVYAKDLDKARTESLDRTDKDNKRYSNPDDDPGGDWREGNLTAKSYSAKDDYAIQSPFTGELHYPAGHGSWRHPKMNILKWLSEWGSEYQERDIGDKKTKALVFVNQDAKSVSQKAFARLKQKDWPFLWFGRDGLGRPRVKTYLEQIKKGKVPVTYWADEDLGFPAELDATSWGFRESGRSSDGVSELTSIVGEGHGFTTVKPLKLFTKLIQIWCPPNGIVLDPFAGSGTTGHAVLSLNDGEEVNRRFILIEQSRPEKGDPYARTLTAERLKRVITGAWHMGEQQQLLGGFTFKTSTTQVDRNAVLAMQREEMVDLILMSHWDARSRKGPMLTTLVHKDYKYLVAKDAAKNGYFLVWDGPGTKTPLTVAALGDMMAEARAENLAPPYHVYARISHVMTPNVIFYQIPDEILNKIGFNDAFGIGENS